MTLLDPVAAAAQIVSWLSEGKHALVRARFDPAMSAAMPTDDAVAQLWLGLEGQLGKLERVIAVRQVGSEGGYAIVHATCAFATMPMDLRLVFDAELRVAGLFVRPADGPDVFGPRPQTPKAPFPYDEREVLYDNPTDGSKLGGTLTLPRSAPPHPAVLLITGSGSQDRDETIMGHKPFWVIADHLTRQGIAVLRVDDRGVGSSTGDPRTATIHTHATDVEAGVAFLGSQPEIDPRRIGLVGHSEGGILAAIVASRSRDVAFVVSLAGSGVAGAELLTMQAEASMRAEEDGTFTEEGIAAIVDAQRRMMALVVGDADEATQRRELADAVAIAMRHAGHDEQEKARIAAAITAGTAALQSPWFTSFVKLDPAAYWEKVGVPVLALVGDKDTQVPADANLAAITAALARAGNPDVTAEKLTGLNHLFQHAKSGAVKEYARIEETFDPATLERIATWLRTRAGGAG